MFVWSVTSQITTYAKMTWPGRCGSDYDDSCQARLNTELGGGAWCPSTVIDLDHSLEEWLEADQNIWHATFNFKCKIDIFYLISAQDVYSPSFSSKIFNLFKGGFRGGDPRDCRGGAGEVRQWPGTGVRRVLHAQVKAEYFAVRGKKANKIGDEYNINFFAFFGTHRNNFWLDIKFFF